MAINPSSPNGITTTVCQSPVDPWALNLNALLAIIFGFISVLSLVVQIANMKLRNRTQDTTPREAEDHEVYGQGGIRLSTLEGTQGIPAQRVRDGQPGPWTDYEYNAEMRPSYPVRPRILHAAQSTALAPPDGLGARQRMPLPPGPSQHQLRWQRGTEHAAAAVDSQGYEQQFSQAQWHNSGGHRV